MLIYNYDVYWLEILFWINENSSGKVTTEKFQDMYFEPGLAQHLYRTRVKVVFENSDDALFCKIKYPPVS